MPSSLLFAVNNEGRVYTLSTGHSMWKELQYVGQEFKRLSSVPHFLWAVGGDHQVYVYVHGLDIPIRVKEESYENERWLPLEGFSSHLLPTDRYHFSNVDGTTDRAIDKIRVPSMAWQWEGDWHLDLTLDGQPLDHTGWSYAIDFPAHYHARKQWKSCVRRRKWIRYRRYSAMNSWCAIAPLHKDPTQEPFIDVSIGGQNVPGANGSTTGSNPMSVWVVTAHGRVFYRTGVSTTSPEGQRWTIIPLPPQCEVNQISIGPTGLVWAVLLNGRALVRHGVNKDNLTGDTWVEVRPPGEGLRLIHVSVGTNSVWGVTNDKKVWFRKGVRGDAADISEDMAMGSGWVEMVGNMSCVSVAPNDQVWGVGAEDRCIYFRMGVTSNELTGKKWRMVQSAVQLSRASSNASLNLNLHRQSLSGSIRDRHRSLSNLNRPHSTYVEPCSLPYQNFDDEQSHSAPTLATLKRPNSLSSGDNNLDIIHDASMSSISEHQKEPEEHKMPEKITGKHFETPLKNPKVWSPVRSVGSVVGTEAHPETDCSIWDADLTRDSGVYGDDDDTATFYWAESDSMWFWVEAAACTVDSSQLPNWFLDVGSNQTTDLTQSWRIKILEKLRSRMSNLSEGDFKNYENAIETTSWVRKGEARCFLPTANASNVIYEDCIIELEWIGNNGTFTILNPDGATTKSQFSLSEVTGIMCCSEPGNPRLAIHIPRLYEAPLKLQFTGDTDMEDWMANLTSVCCKFNEVHGRPSNNSVWTVTSLGDVLVFDPTTMEANQQMENKNFAQNFDVSGKFLPLEEILYNSFEPETFLEITGCIHDDVDRFIVNLVSHPVLKIKHKAVSEIRCIPMHFNPRFNDNVVVRNSMIEGEWGSEERHGGFPFQKGQEFSIFIMCEEKGFRVSINNEEFCFYEHRLPPKTIHKVEITGKVKLFKLSYQSNRVIINPLAMFWYQMGGHLRRVETCPHGVTWGLGYDHTAWVYTGGWGGAFLKGLESSTEGINPMCDIQDYYVYENQRWNPLTGYTSTGLPTDRYMWSDITGKHKRNKEHIKLLSMHYHWVSDWMIDFHTPGGVDRDGWQYAVDFPATYHANKQFTDYVRRRRWYRRCAITTTGPWLELTGSTKILDISLHVSDKNLVDSPIYVWAVAMKGDAIFRRGVCNSNPSGSVWEHVPSDQPLATISCGPGNAGSSKESYFYQVWATGRNGSAFWRSNITNTNPQGENWITIEPPSGGQLKQISVGKNMIWALDSNGRLCIRKEITDVFPEGSHWQILQNDPSNTDINPNTSSGFRHVFVGATEVWAVTNSGYICYRCGITTENPAGTGWNFGINGNFQYVTARGFQ